MAQQFQSSVHSYWQALYAAFYSKRLYADVVKFWRGWGIAYLLLVISLGAIPLSARVIADFNQFFERQILYPLQHLPVLYIQNGKVLFGKEMPYVIKNDLGQIVSIVDTTGTIATINKDYPQLSILITQSTLYFRPPSVEQFLGASTAYTENKIYSYSLAAKGNGILDSQNWIKTSRINKLVKIIDVLIFPIMTLVYWSFYCIFMFVLAVIGQLLADTLLGLKLQFKQSCRLLAVAATPQIICLFLLRTEGVGFANIGWAYLGLVILYYFCGLLSVKRAQDAQDSVI